MTASARRLLGWLGAGTVVVAAGTFALMHNPPILPPVPVAAPLPPAGTAARVLPPQQLADFLEFLQVDAATQGIAPRTLATALAGIVPDPEVIDLASAQPEFVKTAGEYITQLVSDARVEAGRQKLAEHSTLLQSVEADYGVDRHVVVAIWGIESNFGTAMGVRNVARSLATLAAYDTRRPEFWRNELLALLKMVETGEAGAATLAGSWAGASGHTQFMPSTYLAHAVDFDRDGRRDIWGGIPDALASTANYLKASGWKAGEPWGFEVKLPPAFDYGLARPETLQTWAQWQALGVELANPRPIVGALAGLQLLLPSGATGPAFLVGDGFRAILKYNNATAYALAVGHLADRLAGAGSLTVSWPLNDRPLGRADREEIQRRLTALGFDAGGVDGIVGNGTKAAIRRFQKTRALPEDGHADLALLERLRQEGSR